MNRIQLWADKSETSLPPPEEAEPALLTRSRRQSVPHKLFAPLHYEPNYAYPLLVWLHGPAADERQLPRVMPKISTRNYVAVAPRGNCACDSGEGYHWGDSDTKLVSAEQRVFECIEVACERFHVARQRVFLAGLHCGGTMAFRIGLRNPDQIAGVLSVGGPFPLGRAPLVRLSQIRNLPLFIAQGRESIAYPPERTCEELRLFHAAGLCVTVRQYPGGDEIDAQMLRDMDVWMMEQVTGVSDTPEPNSPSAGETN